MVEVVSTSNGGDEALNLEVSSTGHNPHYQQPVFTVGGDDQRLGGPSNFGSASNSFTVETHIREIEEQVVRRMRSQMQAMEEAKIAAEKRCEIA